MLIAASWGLKVGDSRSRTGEGVEPEMSVFKASASATEPLNRRGMMLLNCLRGRGKSSSPFFIAFGRGEGR